MHNLHLIIAHADSHQEAWEKVKTVVEDQQVHGTDGMICGSIREDGNIALNDGYILINYLPSSYSLESLNELARSWVRENERHATAWQKVCQQPDLASAEDWYQAARYCDFQYQTSHNSDPFDLWNDDFRPERFDIEGVTHLDMDEDEASPKYCVFLDMYS